MAYQRSLQEHSTGKRVALYGGSMDTETGVAVSCSNYPVAKCFVSSSSTNRSLVDLNSTLINQ